MEKWGLAIREREKAKSVPIAVWPSKRNAYGIDRGGLQLLRQLLNLMSRCYTMGIH